MHNDEVLTWIKAKNKNEMYGDILKGFQFITCIKKKVEQRMLILPFFIINSIKTLISQQMDVRLL